MNDSTKHPDPGDGELGFPDESDWLELPCPEVSPDFVEDTWQYVRASLGTGAVAADSAKDDDADAAADPDSIALPQELLEAYAVPPPSPGFVDATWAAVRASAWRRALAQHRVPDPTPDFVERVLRALREQREPAVRGGVLHYLRSARVQRLALAAAVLVAALLYFTRRDPGEPFEVRPSRSFSPDPWAVQLTSLNDGGLAAIPDHPALRLGELAGLEVTR